MEANCKKKPKKQKKTQPTMKRTLLKAETTILYYYLQH